MKKSSKPTGLAPALAVLANRVHSKKANGATELDHTITDPVSIGPVTAFPNKGHIVGDPMINALEIDGPQAYADSCAIKAQEVILERFTNREISEHDLVEFATRKGWYEPGVGTLLPDVGKLLEEAGIPVSRSYDATIFDLYDNLAQGKQIIIGVDGAELRGDDPLYEFFEELFQGPLPDHAVIVSGVNARTGGVFITDPATGLTSEYSFSRLTSAWQDSNFYMVSTDIPAPPWVPGLEDFSYELGHIADIGGIPYGEFTGNFADTFSTVSYTSPFDLTDFLEVAPMSYGRLLNHWYNVQGMAFPQDWAEICFQDSKWLSGAAAAAGVEWPPDVGGAVDVESATDGEFLDLAESIYESLFGII